MSLPRPGRAARGPALLGWSSTVARHAETVPVRLRNAMIMFTQVGLQRSRRLWPECTAHVEIVGTVLRPSQESRPVVCAQRYRSALPLGKALCGCAAPLPPPLRTAVRQCTGRRTQAAGEAALRVRVMLPAHWSLSVPPVGQSGGVWLPRRATFIRAARLLSQAAAPARWPIGATGRAGRWLHRPIAGCSGQALLTRAVAAA